MAAKTTKVSLKELSYKLVRLVGLVTQVERGKMSG